MRDRLEQAKAKQGRHRGINVKYGAGGMLDVYFATRYLQLLHDVADEGEDRSTQTTLEHLHAADALDSDDFATLSSGYVLLRSIDHHLRLILGRAAQLPATDHPALKEIAQQLNFASASALHETLIDQMKGIRETYNRITT